MRATFGIEEFTRRADKIVESVPPELLRELNGGIVVADDEKHDAANDCWIMGEYVTDPLMGCYVVLYYRSFVKVLGRADAAEWEGEIEETVWHELRHHVEYLGGQEDLARMEEEGFF